MWLEQIVFITYNCLSTLAIELNLAYVCVCNSTIARDVSHVLWQPVSDDITWRRPYGALCLCQSEAVTSTPMRHPTSSGGVKWECLGDVVYKTISDTVELSFWFWFWYWLWFWFWLWFGPSLEQVKNWLTLWFVCTYVFPVTLIITHVLHHYSTMCM